MLFMAVYSYTPENREEIINRRAEGLFIPEGAKMLGQYSALAGGTVFTLIEASDPLVAFQCFHGWNNLGEFEIFPVMDTDELMKAMAAMQ